MTSPESFVSRWARLKRGSDVRRGTGVAADGVRVSVAETPATGVEGAAQPEIAAAADTLFDPASLPSIDAIGIDSDIRCFLQSRVPAELTRAALRQAWARDPAIRDFIGIAENQWDFNDPDAIPGFGPLPEGYDVSGLLFKRSTGATGLPQRFRISLKPLNGYRPPRPIANPPIPISMCRSARNPAVCRTIDVKKMRHLKIMMSPRQMIAHQITVVTAVRCRGMMDSTSREWSR